MIGRISDWEQPKPAERWSNSNAATPVVGEQNFSARVLYNLRFARECPEFASCTGVTPMTIKIIHVLATTVALCALILGTAPSIAKQGGGGHGGGGRGGGGGHFSAAHVGGGGGHFSAARVSARIGTSRAACSNHTVISAAFAALRP